MDPYKTLTALSRFNSIPATLEKEDGREIYLDVKSEERKAENLPAESIPAVVEVRAWSAISDSLEEKDYPTGGDFLRIDSGSKTRRYKVARESTTGRFWSWFFNKPGYKILFFTKFNPE